MSKRRLACGGLGKICAPQCVPSHPLPKRLYLFLKYGHKLFDTHLIKRQSPIPLFSTQLHLGNLNLTNRVEWKCWYMTSETTAQEFVSLSLESLTLGEAHQYTVRTLKQPREKPTWRRTEASLITPSTDLPGAWVSQLGSRSSSPSQVFSDDSRL